MAKNTNPITKKIYGQSSWSTITFNSATTGAADLYHDIFIRKLIHGACLKLNILTSQIQILKHATGVIEINFMFLPLSFTPGSFKTGSSSRGRKDIITGKKIIELKTCIKSILELKFVGKTYKFKILQAPNLFCNAKILTDFIEIKLSENPRTHRPLMLKLFNEFKKTGDSSSSTSSGSSSSSRNKQSKLSLVHLTKTYLLSRLSL